MSNEDLIIVVNDLNNGLYYCDNVINNSNYLFTNIDKNIWIPLSKSPNSRLVQYYGFLYDYRTCSIDKPAQEIPLFLYDLRDDLTRICRELELIDDNYIFNQIIINNYTNEQCITAHTDFKKYGKVIGCYSIGDEAIMNFLNDEENLEVKILPNSLYIMSGDIRYKWKHEMYKLKGATSRRISITFRNVSK